MSETKIHDDLIEELLVLEDPYHAKEKRHKKIPKNEMPFLKSDIKKAIAIIMKLMEDHNMTPEKIRTKVNQQVKWDPFWRINELLDKVQEIRVKGAKSKLRGQIEFIKQHTLYRPPSEKGSDEGGLMFKKVAQNYKSKSGAKKKKKITKKKRKNTKKKSKK